MPVGYGEPAMSFGIRDQHVPVAPHAYEQSNVTRRDVAVPAMPRHRDAQLHKLGPADVTPPAVALLMHRPLHRSCTILLSEPVQMTARASLG